jgi:hypothetical protein
MDGAKESPRPRKLRRKGVAMTNPKSARFKEETEGIGDE